MYLYLHMITYTCIYEIPHGENNTPLYLSFLHWIYKGLSTSIGKNFKETYFTQPPVMVVFFSKPNDKEKNNAN